MLVSTPCICISITRTIVISDGADQGTCSYAVKIYKKTWNFIMYHSNLHLWVVITFHLHKPVGVFIGNLHPSPFLVQVPLLDIWGGSLSFGRARNLHDTKLFGASLARSTSFQMSMFWYVSICIYVKIWYHFWSQEYDIANDNSKNPRERLARQKQNLRRRLG